MENSLSIILPVYNEEKNIERVVIDAMFNIPKCIRNLELIIIDDGSKDNSLFIIKKLAFLYPELRFLRNSKNEGYGAAIRRGISIAKKEWLFIMDADGQFTAADFRIFWNKRKEYDFLIGYRKRRKDNICRKILAKLGNYLSNLILRMKQKVKDINCGYKLFKTGALKRMSLKSKGGIIDFEILYNLAKAKHNKFIQIPVKHYQRVAGRATGGNLKVIAEIIIEGIRTVLKSKSKIC